MIHLFRQIYDKVVFALALVAAASSAGWFWRQQAFIRSIQREPIRSVLAGPAYVAETLPWPATPVARWSNPPAQSRGSGWLYEVFSPPTITYNAIARTFAVPALAFPQVPVGTVCEVELLKVKREPYRLQVLGYFGEPGDYVAAFASPLSPETLLARPGHRFGGMGLTLKSFAVRKVTVESDEYGPGCEVAAQAVLQDEAAGTEVVLDSRTRKLTDTPLAELKIPGVSGGPRELREGDTFSDDAASYRVEHIQLDPPEVVLARMSPGLPGPEMNVLRPVNQIPGKSSPPKPLSPQAASDVAAANP
jgi:hypothetical protein